jgi:hypothetical protein
MYVNGKMIPGMGGGRIKENGGEGGFKCNILNIL